MFQVQEHYRINKAIGNYVRTLGNFDDLQEADAFARSAYEEARRVPESERVSIEVVNGARECVRSYSADRE